MKKKLKENGFIKKIIIFLLCVYSSIAIFLIGNTILSSFKTKEDLLVNTFGLPKEVTGINYVNLFTKDAFYSYFENSLLLTCTAVILLIFFSSMTAYGLSRFQFKNSGILKGYFLIGLMLPIQLGILPLFVIMKTLRLTNNIFGVSLLYAANFSFPVYVFTKFFQTLPHSLYEAAKIDGAGEFKIFYKIMLPIAKPVIATVFILNFVLIWNDFYIPLVFLSKKEVRTLTVAVNLYANNFLANWDLIFPAVTVALIPIILVYAFFSKKIIEGLTAGSVKE